MRVRVSSLRGAIVRYDLGYSLRVPLFKRFLVRRACFFGIEGRRLIFSYISSGEREGLMYGDCTGSMIVRGEV